MEAGMQAAVQQISAWGRITGVCTSQVLCARAREPATGAVLSGC
jgi:hypothetical protein